MMEPTFAFRSELEPWKGDGSNWIFATVPMDESEVIKDIAPDRRGFGSLKVRVRIGEVEWKTSIFPMKEGTFFLPVKKEVRTKAKVDVGDSVDFELDLLIAEL
jgi:hypothetical protein